VSRGGGSAGLALLNIFISNVKEHAGRIVKYQIARAGGGREEIERGTQRMESLAKRKRAERQRASKCICRDSQSCSASLQKERAWKAEPWTGGEG